MGLSVERVIKDYSRLIHKICYKFTPPKGFDHDDLYQEACLGIMVHIKKYDPIKSGVPTFLINILHFCMLNFMNKHAYAGISLYSKANVSEMKRIRQSTFIEFDINQHATVLDGPDVHSENMEIEKRIHEILQSNKRLKYAHLYHTTDDIKQREHIVAQSGYTEGVLQKGRRDLIQSLSWHLVKKTPTIKCLKRRINRPKESCKLTSRDVKELRDLLKHRVYTQKELAKLYNVHVNTLYLIKYSKTWKE